MASPLWRQIPGDVLARPLYQGKDDHAAERAGVGDALIAGIGMARSTATARVAIRRDLTL